MAYSKEDAKLLLREKRQGLPKHKKEKLKEALAKSDYELLKGV